MVAVEGVVEEEVVEEEGVEEEGVEGLDGLTRLAEVPLLALLPHPDLAQVPPQQFGQHLLIKGVQYLLEADPLVVDFLSKKKLPELMRWENKSSGTKHLAMAQAGELILLEMLENIQRRKDIKKPLDLELQLVFLEVLQLVLPVPWQLTVFTIVTMYSGR